MTQFPLHPFLAHTQCHCKNSLVFLGVSVGKPFAWNSDRTAEGGRGNKQRCLPNFLVPVKESEEGRESQTLTCLNA